MTKTHKNRYNKLKSYCPNMSPDNLGNYVEAKIKSILKYRNKNYHLMTCCNMCSNSMKNLAKNNPVGFKKIYIKKIDKKGNVHLKNKKTQAIVQIMTVIKKKTKNKKLELKMV